MTEQDFIGWALKGNRSAIDYCNIVFGTSQVMDDLIDRDKPVSNDQIHELMWKLMVDLPSNAFFMRYFNQLVPLHRQYLNDYRDANILERHGNKRDLQISFVLRDSVSTLIIQVAYLIGGKEWMDEISIHARKMIFDEPFSSYKKSLEK